MDSRDNILNLDVGRLQELSQKVTELLQKECREPIEAMYVLKATLYLLRGALIEAGLALDNEAQIDAVLTGMIDRAIDEDR
jgi:hypothetical protein